MVTESGSAHRHGEGDAPPGAVRCHRLFLAESEGAGLVTAMVTVRKMDPRPIYFRFWCLMTNTTKLD